MKIEWKPLLMIYAFAAFLVAVFLLSIKLQLPFVFSVPLVRDESNYNAYNEASLKDGAVSAVALSLYLQVLGPSLSDPERKFELVPYSNIGAYVRDDNDQLDVKGVCIDSISLLVNPWVRPHEFLKEPACHEFNEDDWFGDYVYNMGNGEEYNLTNHWYTQIPYQVMVPYVTDHPDIVGSNFWFPYDSFVIDSNLQAQTTISLSDGTTKTETIPIYYEWKLQSSSSRPWDISLQNEIVRVVNEENISPDVEGAFHAGYYQWTQIAFRRTAIYRIAFPVLLIAMVIFISLVPLLTRSGIDAILGVQTGLLFATFAIRSILSPGREIGQTLIEVSVIGLNVLQVFSAVVLFVRVARKKRLERIQAQQ